MRLQIFKRSKSVDEKIAISLDNVSYYYKTYDEQGVASPAVGVEGVSLQLAEGSFVALVGHNGCGKSTLAKLLNGLLLPKTGKVTVFGMDTTDKNAIFDIRRSVGMVFQNPDNQMVASIVEEDVAFGPENLGLPSEEIRARVDEALALVDMSEFVKRSPSALSGGQKQRIAVAGALAIKPRVLVLDESTAMLDPQGRKEVLAVAHKLNKGGMTVVLITHFPDEVVDCDKVFVMDHGHIVTSGTPDEVFADDKVLADVGLRAPRTVELAKKLKAAGFDVDEHCHDDVALGGAVCKNLR